MPTGLVRTDTHVQICDGVAEVFVIAPGWQVPCGPAQVNARPRLCMIRHRFAPYATDQRQLPFYRSQSGNDARPGKVLRDDSAHTSIRARSLAWLLVLGTSSE